MDREDFYALVFRAAAFYTAAWGAGMALFPDLLFDVLGLPRSAYPVLASGTGVMVGAFAYACWVVSRDPRRHPELVALGLLTRTLGVLVWAWYAWLGQIPMRALWISALQDGVWIPFFAACLLWQRRTRMEELIARAGTG